MIGARIRPGRLILWRLLLIGNEFAVHDAELSRCIRRGRHDSAIETNRLILEKI